VEVQRSDKGAGRKRARYNSSMMDANLLKKGEDFDKLPETWVIFITENDVMGKGLLLYPIERCFLGTGERFEDGSHILYVNSDYCGDTPIGKLMHDFSCIDAADMYYGTLADRVRFFKESKEGIEIMCRAMEDMRNQTLKEGAINSAKRMLADGILTLEKIAEYAGLSLDEVKKLKAERTA
jgi:predicted HTH domain antitoxin